MDTNLLVSGVVNPGRVPGLVIEAAARGDVTLVMTAKLWSELEQTLGMRVAESWWGPGLDRVPLEVDVVAESADGSEVLVGEVKWQDTVDWPREIAALRSKAERLPLAKGRALRLAFWSKRAAPRPSRDVTCLTPRHVLAALR